MKNLKGIFSALLVSFDKNGKIDENGTREIIRHNIDKMKVDGLYVGGSTGENFMLSTEEKKQIFKLAYEETNGKVALIAQIGSINLTEAIELGKYATELGYDALSAVTPFYYKFSFDEIKDYYDTLTRETGNNMIVYSISALTGVSMGIEEFRKLFENPKIIGVKFTEGNLFLLERIRHAFPEKLVYSGFDEMLLSACVLDVDGAIGSTYNINGLRAKEIFSLAKKGEIEKARILQKESNEIIERILKNGLFQTIKEVLKCQGVNAGYCKKPFKELSTEQIQKAKEIFSLI